jgi:hypothetical protein
LVGINKGNNYNKSHAKVFDVLNQHVTSKCPGLSENEASHIRKKLKKIWRKLDNHLV